MTHPIFYANAFGSTFAFLADTQSPTKMQKSYQANAQGTHSAALDTVFNLTDQEEGRTHNMGFAAMLADEYILIFLFAISSSSSRRNSI